MKQNYQRLLEKEINVIREQNYIPKLLLHACCAPCCSYVLEYLSDYFTITVFFYNPNIMPRSEYDKRMLEMKRLTEEMTTKNLVSFMEGDYDNHSFLTLTKDFIAEPEGGYRCQKCFLMRLSKVAEIAKLGGFDYFTTTLTVSPYKDAQEINKIGESLSSVVGINYLYSDFKKNDGYKKSIVLSKKYNLYRQNYCGCSFSKS